jgi:hypothetical protein
MAINSLAMTRRRLEVYFCVARTIELLLKQVYCYNQSNASLIRG